MKKKKVLLALLMTCIATTGVVALAGCAKNKGNNNNTNIENPDVPLDPGGNTQCDHANATHFAKVDATCTANGTEEYWYCAACEKHFSDAALTQETTLTELTILAHHTPGEDLIEEVAATCTKEGIKAHYVCEECHLNLDAEGNVLHDLTLPKKAHTMEHVEAHEAHCDSTGNLEYWYCSDCGVYYLDEAGTNGTTLEGVTLPKAHVFTYVQGSPATCTEAGVVEHWHCGECNKDFDAQGNELSTTVINALGHTMTHHDKVDETCTEAGTVEYWECEVCHKKYSDENGEHEITNIVIEPNTDNHKFTEWVEEVPATCTTAGVKGHYDCEDCGKHFDINHNEIEDLTIAVDENAHTYGEWIEEVPATCTSDGVKGHYHCADCGKDFDEEHNVLESLVIPAAHKLTHVDAVGATCTTDGNVEYWECSECGKKFADAAGKEELDSVVIPAAHKLTHVEAKAPTCEEAGNIEYWECSECGAKFLDEAGEEAAGDVSLPATGHSWADEWTYDKETRTYNRICNNDEEHVEPQAAGVSAEFAYLVDDIDELNAVIALGGYIRLTADIETASALLVNGNVNIDLNGKKLTSSDYEAVYLYTGANLVIKNGSVTVNGYTEIKDTKNNVLKYAWGIEVGIPEEGSESTLTTVALEKVDVLVEGDSVYQYGVGIYGKTDLQISGGSIKVTGTKGLGIGVAQAIETTDINVTGTALEGTACIELRKGKAEFTRCTLKSDTYAAGVAVKLFNEADITLTDCSVAGNYYAVAGNGTTDPTLPTYGKPAKATLNNCTLTSVYCGVYQPQAGGELYVNGGSITVEKECAIEVRSGIVVVDGATLTTNGTFSASKAGGGTSMTGVALAVSQHTSNEPIEVNVTDTILNGVYAVYERDMMDDTARDKISITLGEGNEINGCVYSENCANIEESHTFGEWAWNADNSVYEQTCESCGKVVSHEADGSEQFPWVVTDAESLKAAVAEGGYITLSADIEAMITIAADKEVNLNLNGYRLSYEGTQVKKSGTIVNNGTLTLTGNGTVYNGVHQMAAIVNKGTATLNGVTLQRPYVAKTETTSLNSYYVIDNAAGEMTILDVHVLTDPADTFSSLVHNANETVKATLTIEGGTFENGDIVIKNEDSGLLYVNGGTFNGAQGVQNWGTAYINGGDVKFVRTGVWSSDYKGVTYINDDNFSGGLELQCVETWVGQYLTDDNTPVLKVKDGIFHDQPVMSYAIGNKSYVATEEDGYSLVTTNEEGYAVYSLALPAFATDEASFLAALENGGYIRLAKDVTLTTAKTFTVTDTLHIDLNGKTLNTAMDTILAAKDGGNLTIVNGNLKMSRTPNKNGLCSKSSIDVYTGSSVTLDGVSMTTNGYSLFPAGDAASVTVRNSIIRATTATALGTNAGTTDNYNVVVNIEDSTLFGYFEAVIFNVPGTFNATNSKFYGINRAIFLRAGDAVLTDCTLQNNVSNVSEDGKELTRCLTDTTSDTLTFNSYYDVTNTSSWGQGNINVPLNALVVGSGKGNYAKSATCVLNGCTLVDDFVGIKGTDKSGNEVKFIHHSIYATTDGTEGAVASVTYDAATVEKSGESFSTRHDVDAKIEQA